MGTIAPDFGYLERAIRKLYGYRVSFGDAANALYQFGVNLDVDANTTETVWRTGGIETLPTDNSITSVVSSDAGDTNEIVIQGHELAGGQFRFVNQAVTLTGTTPVALGTPLARVQRGYNNSASDLAGTVTVTSSGGTHLTIVPEVGQSEKAAFTVASDSFLFITRIQGGIAEGSGGTEVLFRVRAKAFGKAWRERYQFTLTDAALDLTPAAWVLPGSDVRIDASASSNNTTATATVIGAYALIIEGPSS